MRFLLAAAVPNSRHTGMGKWAHRVADALMNDGHEVTLWFDEDLLGTQTSSTPAKVLLYPLRLAWQIINNRHQLDVVFVHEPGGFWYGLARKVWPSLPPLVAMCHNVESKWFRQRKEAARRGFALVPRGTRVKTPLFRSWQTDGTIRLADHVVCLSSEDREYIVSTLGRRHEDVTRVVNGVAPDDFGAPAGRSGLGLLFVGGWLDVKGSRLLPSVFHKLRAQKPEAVLTIAGSGVSAETVLSDFDPSDRLHVTVLPGYLDAPALGRLYRSHAVFCMPSLSEGSPLSLLEAMAAGCAVVAAAVGGVPDIVRDGTDGLLFEAMNADAAAAKLASVLTDPGLADSLGAAAVGRARGFTWGATAEGLERAARVVVTGTVCHA